MIIIASAMELYAEVNESCCSALLCSAGNLWQVDGVAERIMETVEWRMSFGLPAVEHSLVRGRTTRAAAAVCWLWCVMLCYSVLCCAVDVGCGNKV